MAFYRLQPVWEEGDYKNWESFFDCVINSLFDAHGTVEWVENGFQCLPDENHANTPVLTIDTVNKIICFALCGFPEKEIGKIIQTAVEDFGETFTTDIEGITVECWEYDYKKRKSVLIASQDISDREAADPNVPRHFNYKTGNA